MKALNGTWLRLQNECNRLWGKYECIIIYEL